MKRLNDCWSPMVAALILGGSPWRGPRSAAIAEPDSMPTITVANRLARMFLFVIGGTSSSGLLSWVMVHACFRLPDMAQCLLRPAGRSRSEEHTSELQSLMRISYAVFCLKKKKTETKNKDRE